MRNYASTLVGIMCLSCFSISLYGQPQSCIDHVLAIEKNDSATIVVGQFVNNANLLPTLKITLRNPNGGILAVRNNANAATTIRFYACPYVTRTLTLHAEANGGELCMSNIRLHEEYIPIIEGRKVTVWCDDPVISQGKHINGVPPTAVIPCQGEQLATYTADWTDVIDCDASVPNDTAKIIYRMYEAFGKDGSRSIGQDTIIVLRLPAVTVDNTFCRMTDSLDCNSIAKVGPYMIARHDFATPNGVITKNRRINFVNTYRNPDGTLGFRANELDPKCGISVSVSSQFFGGDCPRTYKVKAEIKQSCAGGNQVPNLPVTNFDQDFHPSCWSYSRNDLGDDITIEGNGQQFYFAFAEGSLNHTNPLLSNLTPGGGLIYDLNSFKGELSMCNIIPHDGTLGFQSAVSGSGVAGYRLNGKEYPLTNGIQQIGVKSCDELCFYTNGEASLELANFAYNATLADPPITMNSPGYYVCEFWVSEIDTTPPTIEIVQDGREWDADTLLVQSSGHSCLAHVMVPSILAEDDCHEVKMVKVRSAQSGTYQLSKQTDGSWKSPDIIEFPMQEEPYQVIYEALDECHQLGRDTIYLRVKDLIDPLAVSNKMLNLSLTGKKVWVDAVNFDEGSWDNCGIETMLARRSDWQEACIDLCSDYDFASGDFYQNYFNHLDTLGEVGSYYANTLKWLAIDPSDCNALILNGWLYDLHRYISLQCQGESEVTFNQEIASLLGDQSLVDEAKLLGGGWSNAVPFSCEDLCDTVTVELMVMDYWCNWNKTWTKVWVEDKTPITVARELDDEVEISCYAYHDANYSLGNQPASLHEIVDRAHSGDEEALAVLDLTFGTYQKAWLGNHGNFIDKNGNDIESEIEFINKQCDCRDTMATVAVLDSHGQMSYKDSTWRVCDYYTEELTFHKGILLVNCPDLIECDQEVWSDIDDCGIGSVYRKFTIRSGCSGHNMVPVELIQTIHVFDRCKLDLGMFSFPADASVESCGLIFDPDGSGNIGGSAHPDSLGRPEFLFDASCYIVGIGYSDKALEIVPQEDDGPCYKIKRTWCLIDWCELQHPDPDWVNNPKYADKTIKYIQYIKVFCECPCLINCSDLRDTAIACADIPQDLTDLYVHFNTPTIESPDTSQPCDGTLSSKTEIDTNHCGAGEIIRTWYLIDPFDNLVDSCKEVISMAPPEIMIRMGKLYKGDAEPFNCSDSIVTDPIVIDVNNCALLGNIVISNDSPFAVNDSNDASGNYPVGDFLVTYTISSNCFASFQVVDTIQVIDDVNPTVVAFSDPCVSKAEWQNDFQNNPLNPAIRMMLSVGGADNCGVDTVLLVDLDSIFFPDQIIRDSIRYIYDWQAVDVNGNVSAVLTTTILVSDLCTTTADVRGVVLTENQQSVSDVMIKTTSDGGVHVDYPADLNGRYSFEPNLESAILVTPYKNSDPKNGLSTADIIYIRDHILGTRPLESKYRKIAADINDDGKINPVDLIQLRKLILGTIDQFPSSDSWRFINDIDGQSNYHVLPDEEGLILNFTGVKIGDVDQSSDPARRSGRSQSEVILTTKDLHFSSGQKHAVEFSTGDLEKCRGFQFTIAFDPNQLTLVALTGNEEIGLDEEHFAINQKEEGMVSVSWDKLLTTHLLTSKLFVLEFQATKECRLSDVFTINSQVIEAEAYDQSLNSMNLALEFKPENTDDSHFNLLQNWPNPFQHNTSISFELPEAMEATVRIFDLTGKMQKYIKGHYQRGINEIQLEAVDFRPGILYYQLEAGEFISTRKMVLIE